MMYDDNLLEPTKEEYAEALKLGLDLDDLNDYQYFLSLKY